MILFMQGALNPHSSFSARRKSRSAFSLIELLVTVAVSFIVIAALLQSMVSSLDSWTRQEKQFSSLREGRAALRLLADDLASIAVIPNGGPLAQDPQSTTGQQIMRFLSQPAAPGSTSTSRLAFLRTVKRAVKGNDSGRGDLQLVLYGVALTPDGGASGLEPEANSQKLVRRQFSAAETYLRLEAHRVSGRPLVFEDDWGALESIPDPDKDQAQPGMHNSVLAHDVIRFDCKAKRSLMPGEPELLEWPINEIPTWVEISLRVTNRQTGRLLKTAQDWRGEGVRQDAITNGTPDVYEDDKEVRTYSMRVRLPSMTL